MPKRKTKIDKQEVANIRIVMNNELWRKFRAGCLYMDKDVNSELNRLIENWVKEWHKRVAKSETTQGEQIEVKHIDVEEDPFSANIGFSGRSGEGGSST
jgi:hypothetical protein